jgi:outer membrane protein OmpA-like peptidoglycan-associated protein
VGKPYGIIKDTLWIEKLEVKKKFVMENIFYDFDKWNILPESEIELNKLIKVMNDNPGWKVELSSHTDARGSDSYNMILSQKRSDSAVSYIVKSGISKDRIIARGYGETQLVNRCKNGVKCPDEEHRKNRRTEFQILEMDNK